MADNPVLWSIAILFACGAGLSVAGAAGELLLVLGGLR